MTELVLRGTLIDSELRLIGDFGHLQLVNADQEIEAAENFPFWDVRDIETAETYGDPSYGGF